MMKETLENSSIKLNDFNTIERGLKYYLRFELGDPFENGTKKRVNQATKRATELFEDHIEESSEVYILIYDLNDEMLARTANYLHEILSTEEIEHETYNEQLALRYFDHETDIEWTKGKLSIYLADRNIITYSEIVNGIANTEMGFERAVHQLVYFYQTKSKKWFWMYDDRGCLMFSDEIFDLRENLKKFDNWIVETQRSEMEKQFA